MCGYISGYSKGLVPGLAEGTKTYRCLSSLSWRGTVFWLYFLVKLIQVIVIWEEKTTIEKIALQANL